MPQNQLPLADLASRAQALLFAEGDSLTIKKLAQLLECEQPMLLQALAELKEKLKETGLTLVQTDLEVALAVSPSSFDEDISYPSLNPGRRLTQQGLPSAGTEKIQSLGSAFKQNFNNQWLTQFEKTKVVN